MWTYHPELLATPVPRYTSFPTAAEFHDGVGPMDLATALDGVGADEAVSLYLHIPFCREICWYCGCNTGAANRVQRLTGYLARLKREVTLVARRLGGRGRIGRIAFGGGSPNAIAADDFLHLVDHVRASFACDDAILSVEVDPRGFDVDWAGALRTAGVSRVSLGVQTFAPRIQAAIGRVQPEAAIERSVALLRDACVESINFDLMYGLPGQSDDDLLDGLERSLALGVDRLAVFGYAHVPHLIPRQRRIDAAGLPDAAARFRQAHLAYERLTHAGHVAVGFDHFAHPDDALGRAARDGTLRRNFQGFTEDGAEVLIGLGASAIGAFPALLAQNDKNAGRYGLAVEAGRLATAVGVRRSPLDRLRARAIERLLCVGQADLTGIPELADIRARLARFAELGLIRWSGAVLRLMPDALPYGRTIAATLDPYRQPNGARFSNAV